MHKNVRVLQKNSKPPSRSVPLASRHGYMSTPIPIHRTPRPAISFYCEVLVIGLELNGKSKEPNKTELKLNYKQQIYYSLGLTCNNGNAQP